MAAMTTALLVQNKHASCLSGSNYEVSPHVPANHTAGGTILECPPHAHDPQMAALF